MAITLEIPMLEPIVSFAMVQYPVSPMEQGLDASDECLRPYVCLFPGCSQRFKRKYTLKDHMHAHTGEKPFVCPVRSCRKTFTTSGNLARHKRLHPWLDAPLACLVDGCGCVFPTEAKLQRHMQSHFNASSVFRCDVGACGRVFSTPGNLRRHLKQRHAGPGHPPMKTAHAESPIAPLVYTDSCRDLLVPNDHELLETLACLFDEYEVDPKPTLVYPLVSDHLSHEGYVCRV